MDNTSTSLEAGASYTSGGNIRKLRSLLYFDTTSLPDDVVISNVIMKIKETSIIGSPFPLSVEMIEGTFGLSPLELTDYNAVGVPATGTFTLLAGGWHQLTLDSAKYKYVNLTGVTQFRLQLPRIPRFRYGQANDYLSEFYSGNDATNPPQLIVEYYLP